MSPPPFRVFHRCKPSKSSRSDEFYCGFLPSVERILKPLTDLRHGNPKRWSGHPPPLMLSRQLRLPKPHHCSDSLLGMQLWHWRFGDSDSHMRGFLQQPQGRSRWPLAFFLSPTQQPYFGSRIMDGLFLHPSFSFSTGRPPILSPHRSQTAGCRHGLRHGSMVRPTTKANGKPFRFNF
jgi:hypothetical protein